MCRMTTFNLYLGYSTSTRWVTTYASITWVVSYIYISLFLIVGMGTMRDESTSGNERHKTSATYPAGTLEVHSSPATTIMDV